MKFLNYLFLLLSFAVFGQNQINTVLVKSTPTDNNSLVSIDEFGTQYFFNANTFLARGTFGNLEYSNIQLGNITTANAFNPLKINLFYDDFNTIILLDNRLAEIQKIDFNLITPFRDISHVSSANDNDIWIFNVNTQQLELFNYKTNKTKYKTLPIEGQVLNITSNYNYCWLLTSNYIYTYSYFGTLISKIKNDGFEAIKTNGQNMYLLKNNKLFFKAKSEDNIVNVKIPELLISQFFVTNETLYIYDGKNVNQYQLIND